MNNPYKYYGEQASKDFIENKVPLTDSVTKIAKEHNLNKHAIDRVVEHANQITYLSLFNNGSDKYASVNFEVADAAAIKESIKPATVKVARQYLDDYTVSPEPVMEKVAEEAAETKIPSVFVTRGTLQKKADYLKAKSGENRLKFTEELNKFASLARTEILLKKLSFEDMNAIFPENFVEKVAEIYNIPGHTKTASESEGYLNEDHDLVESYNNLSKLEDEYIELHKEARQLYKEAVEAQKMHSNSTIGGAGALIEGIAADIAKSWNVIQEIPAKHLVGYPAAFLLGVMYQKTRERKEENSTSQLRANNVPLIYRAF